MAVEIIELDNRVFEATIEPDTPGWRKRTLTVSQLSGRELDEEEWEDVVDAIVEELRRRGQIIHSFGVFDSPDAETL